MTTHPVAGPAGTHELDPSPDLPLRLIRRVPIRRDARIVCVGASSALVADLLREGFSGVAALDARRLAAAPSCSLWYDGGVLHPSGEPAERRNYAGAIRRALALEGWAILGGFAPHIASNAGSRCAGSIAAQLGAAFTLRETHGEVRAAPGGGEHVFRCYIFERRSRR